MIKSERHRIELRRRRRMRVKKKFDRHAGKLRLVVHRSARHMSAQIIDDLKGATLVSASSIEKGLAAQLKGAKSKVDTATRVGEVLAARAVEKKITKVVFDRNGYLYHGRVKALAESARKNGLTF